MSQRVPRFVISFLCSFIGLLGFSQQGYSSGPLNTFEGSVPLTIVLMKSEDLGKSFVFFSPLGVHLGLSRALFGNSAVGAELSASFSNSSTIHSRVGLFYEHHLTGGRYTESRNAHFKIKTRRVVFSSLVARMGLAKGDFRSFVNSSETAILSVDPVLETTSTQLGLGLKVGTQLTNRIGASVSVHYDQNIVSSQEELSFSTVSALLGLGVVF